VTGLQGRRLVHLKSGSSRSECANRGTWLQTHCHLKKVIQVNWDPMMHCSMIIEEIRAGSLPFPPFSPLAKVPKFACCNTALPSRLLFGRGIGAGDIG
jgi:hypothetical protein